MEKIKIHCFSIIIFLILSNGCLSAPSFIPKEFKKELDIDLNIHQLCKDPDKYIGSKVLLGGVIISIQNFPLKTEVIILGKPLDKRNIPITSAYTTNKFVATYKGYLDRLIYSPWRLITIAGQVSGKTKGKIKGIFYPKVDIEYFYLWPPQEPYYYPPFYRIKEYNPHFLGSD